MEEAGSAGGSTWRLGPAHQLYDRCSTVHSEAHQIRGAIQGPEADDLLVEALRAIEVRDDQANRAHAHLIGHEEL